MMSGTMTHVCPDCHLFANGIKMDNEPPLKFDSHWWTWLTIRNSTPWDHHIDDINVVALGRRGFLMKLIDD